MRAFAIDGAGVASHHAAMDGSQLALVTGVFMLAGSVKGVTGMGLPTVAMSLLGLWMAPLEAAALLLVPTLVTNAAQCRGPHLREIAARLWPGWLAITLVTALAPGLGTTASSEAARPWLGAILIVYGLWGLWRPALPDLSGHSAWWSAAVGAATGAVTALTAVFVLPWVPYLQTLRWGKDEMVQALGLSFTVATLALALRVHLAAPRTAGWWVGQLPVTVGFAVAGAWAGLALGAALRGRLAGPTFQKALFAVFIALGLANLTGPA